MLSEKGIVMQSWNEMSKHDQLAATHYDFYKSVHGVRPRWINYDECSEQDLESMLDQLGAENDIQMAMEAEREAKAIEDVEHVILNLLMSGARSREMAIGWLHEAHDSNGDNDYLCYLLGLPYRYFDK